MPEIGATLREARMRARIDVSEIEAQTKIRARYLRALENEEWDLLPGPTFIKSFLRTYAAALGLDGRALVDEYRVHYERPSEQDMQPLATHRRRGRSSRGELGGPSRGYRVTVALIAVIIVFLVIGLLTRSSSPSRSTARSDHHGSNAQRSTSARSRSRSEGSARGVPAARGLTVSLQATGTVWVCLVDQAQRKLIPGVELQAGQASGPFRSHSFEITLGNANVDLKVNGTPMSVPASARAIGYSITTAGLSPLTPARQPTCA